MRSKSVLLCTAILWMTGSIEAQPFITQWNMNYPGSAPGQLSFGVVTSGPCSYSWETAPAEQSGSGMFSGDTMTISG